MTIVSKFPLNPDIKSELKSFSSTFKSKAT